MAELMLPPALKALADICAGEERGYVMGSVLLKRTESGYEAVSANGRQLALVEGTHRAEPGEFPSAPDNRSDAISEAGLIPGKTFKEVMGLAPKKAFGPFTENVYCALYENYATFTGADGDKSRSITTRQTEGRFPLYREVIPSTPPAASVVVNVALLREMLKIAEAFADTDAHAVTLEFHGKKPLVIRSENGYEKFTGLVMPLDRGKP